ncbi:MAG: FG-GAP repeat protein, partial [Myxococcota bacterium]|nr:FG-GAP repeat protein [Myxococcota bacterium]
MRLALLFVVALCACYSQVSPSPCTLTCDSTTPCPENLVCGDDLRCHTPGQSACVGELAPVASPDSSPSDLFGSALALSADGSTLVVGAPHADGVGAAYVFAWDGATYVAEATLTAPVSDVDDGFGAAVAISADGSVIAVGAPFEDSAASGFGGNASDNTLANAGAIFVFRRNSGWATEYIKAAAPAQSAELGASVALAADASLLVAGSPGPGNASQYIFLFGLSARQETLYVSLNTTPTDRVGGTIELSDDGLLMAAGIPLDNGSSNDLPEAGALYAQRLSLAPRGKVRPTPTEAGDQFGSDVALSANGDRMAVGSPMDDSSAPGIGGDPLDNSMTDAGATWVFRIDANVWTQQVYLKAASPQPRARFGTSVAMSGNGATVVIGAPGEDSGAGAAYLYTFEGSSPLPARRIPPSEPAAGDQFGTNVAISTDGSTVVIGAPHASSGGRVYV